MRRSKIPKRKDGGNWNNEYPFEHKGHWHMFWAKSPNINMVCFDCRFTKRVLATAINEDFKCPHCGVKLTSMWCKIKLPKKSNIKAWKKLKEEHGTIRLR